MNQGMSYLVDENSGDGAPSPAGPRAVDKDEPAHRQPDAPVGSAAEFSAGEAEISSHQQTNAQSRGVQRIRPERITQPGSCRPQGRQALSDDFGRDSGAPLHDECGKDIVA